MKLKNLILCIAIAVLVSTPAHAQQVQADLVAAPGIPQGGGPFAPHTPSGEVIIGSNIWVGDKAQGFRHYIPVDPTNTDPINTGPLMFDINTEWSIGGGVCLPWCSVGQAAQDGSSLAYLAVWVTRKGNRATSAGRESGWFSSNPHSATSARLRG